MMIFVVSKYEEYSVVLVNPVTPRVCPFSFLDDMTFLNFFVCYENETFHDIDRL